MSAKRYDVFFSGNTLDDADVASVKQKIAGIFNASAEQLEYLFSGSSIKIKHGVDQETAIKYRVAFRNAGALVDIRATESTTPEQKRDTTATGETRSAETDVSMTLLPANTGSLIDCAPTITPAPIPNIDNITLANLGTLLDDTAPAPPAQIDTSGLQLTPANSGTLEDCQIPKKPAPLPDISRLKILEDGN